MFMSRSQHLSPRHHYFNRNNNIWNTKDGLAVITLYLPSLGKKVRRHHLLKHFSVFGTVKNVKIYNKPTHSFAYITFAEAESATKVLANQFHRIAGRRTRVAIADSRHQDKPFEIEHSDLTISLTTHILDLNDDCIYQIFSTFDISKLCSVARTCTRFRDIANRIFTRNYEVCKVRTMAESFPEARRMLVTFGSMITELWVGGSLRNQVIAKDLNAINNEQWVVLLDLAMRCCSDLKALNLKYLIISDVFAPKLKPLFNNLRKLDILFCKIDGVNKDIFDGCNSLVDFCLVGTDFNLRYIIENIFPKLETFQYLIPRSPFDAPNFEFFNSRHNFKRLAFDCLLLLVAKNYKKLEELVYFGLKASNTEEAFKGMLTLDNLKTLKICSLANLTKLIPNLNSLQSLQCLEFKYILADSEFTKVLSQLQSIQILRLRHCRQLANLHLLGDMNQLTELLVYPTENVDLDLVCLIKSLDKLRSLHLNSILFKMNEEIYLRILDAILGRNVRSQQMLEITCHPPININNTGAELIRLGVMQVPAQRRLNLTVVKLFSLSDAILNLQCVRNNSHILKLRRLPYYDGWVDVFHCKL